MKAIVIRENKNISLEEVKEDDLGFSDVKVMVKYTGICGSDVPRALKNGAHYYPIILGHEFSGIVTEVGEGVSKVKVNDHVVGIPLIPCMKCPDCLNGNYSLCKNYTFIGSSRQGSMAEYIVLNENNVFVIDKNIELLDAAFFEPSTVAYHAIMLNNINDYSNACIIGSGNIAYFTLQWLKILGVKEVTVMSRNEVTLNKMLKYGASHIINTSSDNMMDTVKNNTNGMGYANVFECAGNDETIKMCFSIAANKGHVCLIGTPKGNVTFSVKEWEMINRKELSLVGSWMSYSKPFPGIEWEMTNKELKNGNLVIPNDIIYNVYSMKNGAQAFAEIEKGVTGKIVIENEYSKTKTLSR